MVRAKGAWRLRPRKSTIRPMPMWVMSFSSSLWRSAAPAMSACTPALRPAIRSFWKGTCKTFISTEAEPGREHEAGQSVCQNTTPYHNIPMVIQPEMIAALLASGRRFELTPEGGVIVDAEPSKASRRAERNRRYYQAERLRASENVLKSSEPVLECLTAPESSENTTPLSLPPPFPSDSPFPRPPTRPHTCIRARTRGRDGPSSAAPGSNPETQAPNAAGG